MAIDAAERFLITEVAKSTGLSYATVQGRMVTLGIKNENGITYADIKRIVGYRNKVRKSSQQKIDRLKLNLKNDGFSIKEK